jgi:hypothetical protein
MPSNADTARALELARLLARASETKAPAPAWSEEERLDVAAALLSLDKSVRHARAKALNEAAQLLEDLADREVMQPALVGTYVRIAADIRALAKAG